MLKSTYRSNALCCDWPTPFKTIEIKYKQIIKPEFTITTTKNEHLIVDYTTGMELAHWSFSSDDARNIETEFVNTFFQIDEYHIR